MGLDMYLKKKTYVKNWDHTPKDQIHKITVKLGGKTHPSIKPERISYIEEDVAYWRKANAIHRWFVKNVQGGIDECQTSYVELAQLKELVDACKQVIDGTETVQGDVNVGLIFPDSNISSII